MKTQKERIEERLVEAKEMLKANPLNDYWAGKLTGLEQVIGILDS